MKPIVYILMLILGSSTAFGQKLVSNKPEQAAEEFISVFLKAQRKNDIVTLRKTISSDAIVIIPGKKEPQHITKKEYLMMLQQLGEEQQQCDTYFEFQRRTPVKVTAVISFNYLTYSVQTTVDAEKKSGSWKITKLEKTLMDAPEPVIVEN